MLEFELGRTLARQARSTPSRRWPIWGLEPLRASSIGGRLKEVKEGSAEAAAIAAPGWAGSPPPWEPPAAGPRGSPLRLGPRIAEERSRAFVGEGPVPAAALTEAFSPRPQRAPGKASQHLGLAMPVVAVAAALVRSRLGRGRPRRRRYHGLEGSIDRGVARDRLQVRSRGGRSKCCLEIGPQGARHRKDLGASGADCGEEAALKAQPERQSLSWEQQIMYEAEP